MRPKLNLKFFAKFFWGIATDKEKEHVYNSDESHQMLRKEWEETIVENPVHAADQGDILERIKQEKYLSTPSISLHQKLMRIAAVMILVLAIGSVLFVFTDITDGLIKQEIAYIEKSNPRGQRSQIVLPDKTTIWLNADSKVKYAKNFMQQDLRNIELTGEAYFDVSHNPDRPFIVRANDLNIKVHGTSFNVKAYPDEKMVTTTLVNGSVSLTPPDGSTKMRYLSPGDMGVYSIQEQSLEVRKDVDLHEITAWKEGKLIFDNESFVSIARELERWYGVNIVIPEEIKGKYRYTMTITTENIREVCKLIQETTPVEYNIEGNQIYFIQKK